MEVDERPVVGVIMGSDSDLPVMRQAVETLVQFGVPHEVTIASAHRSPDRTHLYAASAIERGLKVIICGAGWAAHLAGVVAASTILPVIGVPLSSSPLSGLDALLATVQMPSGVPVSTMAMNGARNAAILAIQILALSDNGLAEKLRALKTSLAEGIDEKNSGLGMLLGKA
ncbi:MAG: 5-(carboxyamino)imidazole ribonucleotide mutase [Deltaproteobacteria bacterium]|jgi:phosphoribosylaminoimidazole carboxylase PurE protein|nr:5-(carboxyamino)imidazole ribonucleotide mutase [Deltaproteobacteria bacterium]